MDRFIYALLLTVMCSGKAFAQVIEGDGNMSFAPKQSASLLLPAVHCKNRQNSTSVMGDQSENYMTNLFENIACGGAGDVSSNESLDRNFCSAISKCSYKEKEVIDKPTRGFIKNEALFFLVRELTQAEMKKYLDSNKDNFTELLANIDKLPEDVKSKIRTCAVPSSPSNCTLGEELKTRAMQSNIQGILRSNLNDDMGKVLEKKLVLTENYASLFAKATQAAQENTFEELFEKRKQLEKNSAAFFKNTAPKDSSIDEVFNKLYVDITLGSSDKNVEKLSADKIQSLVKDSLLQAGDLTKDKIFKYNPYDRSAQIERALKDIHFSPSDFRADNENVLKGKLNEIRVRLANHYMETDCKKYNLTLDQVCSNVAQKIGNGTVFEILNNIKEDPFDKMINFYKQSKLKTKDETVAKLESIKNNKDPIFKKFLVYSLRKNICYEKFPDLRPKTPNGESAQKDEERKMANETLKEMSEANDTIRNDGMARAREVARLNVNYQKEINDLGLNLNNDSNKSEALVSLDPYKHQKVENVPVREDELLSSRSFFNDGAMVQNRQTKEQFEAPRQDTGPNYNMATAPEIKNNANSDYETKLRSRLLELENKEKALAKKMAKAAETESTSTEDEKSLSDLRKQIEELKKSQTNGPSQKRAVGSVDRPQTQVSGEAPNAVPMTSPGRSSMTSYRGPVETDSVEKSSSNSNVVQSGITHSDAGSSGGVIHSGQNGSTDQRTNSRSTADKGIGGLILTKNGEVYQDSANIIENPKEGDIANMLEVTNGRPFLIRENGVLIKIVAELDAEGRPQIVRGRVRFKKERLTKAQQEELKKDTNIQKSLKELDRDPTRLYNLKKLLQMTVKRD